MCTCAVSLAIYLSLCELIPVERSVDEDFINNTPFYLQVVYLYLAMLALRPKYYFVWTLGEFDSAQFGLWGVVMIDLLIVCNEDLVLYVVFNKI